jgi:arylsulfatase A-like enzyme
MLHSFSGAEFAGKSANGAWGDSVEELAWSAGEIRKALKRLKLDGNTVVVWTSDNGAPQRQNIPHGSNLPYKGRGYTTAEGGMRMPCIVRWLLKLAENARAELGDEGRVGTGQRPAGHVPSPNARRLP